MEMQPWRCKCCWLTRSAAAQFCPTTGKHWKKVSDPTFVAPRNPPRAPKQDAQWRWNELHWDGQEWKDLAPKKPKPRRPRSTSAARRDGEQEQEQEEASGAQPSNAPFPFQGGGPSAAAAFANISPSPFHPPYATSSSTTPWTAEPNQGDNKEWIAALKLAYPDLSSMPPNLRELVEKSEKNANKQTKAELHKATNALYKARNLLNQLQDAKAGHQAAWCKHLSDAVAAWKKQMALFMEQQKEYSSKIAQARKDVQQAQQAIAELNQKVTNEEQVQLPESKDAKLQNRSQEINQLQEQMQQTLESVAATFGQVDLTEDDSGEVLDDLQAGERDRKRTRSVEPEPAGPTVGPTAAAS